jgi:sec-independent protein translocase protein TatA
MKVLLFALESPTIIILVVAAIFLLFGGSKLPQLAKALGQSKKAFKEGMDEAERANEKAASDSRSKLDSVDDEALFEEARRRAQQIRADETKKIEH